MRSPLEGSAEVKRRRAVSVERIFKRDSHFLTPICFIRKSLINLSSLKGRVKNQKFENMWRNLFREFFSDLGKQKLRSFLTLLAIAWGTLSVVLLLAFGRGLGTSMMEGMLGAGNQVIIIYGGQTSMNYEGLGIGRAIRFTEDDVALIDRAVPDIQYSSPQYGRYGATIESSMKKM